MVVCIYVSICVYVYRVEYNRMLGKRRRKGG